MSRILSPEVSDRAVHLLAACCLSFDPRYGSRFDDAMI
jgi:hypothetical protein